MVKSGLFVETNGDGPIYLQIVQQISSHIRQGTYPPGFKLPTSRQLAQELEVHRNTVVRAYEELTNQGLVECVTGSGTFVSENLPSLAPANMEHKNPLPWNVLISDVVNSEPLTRYEKLARQVGNADYINLSRLHPSDDLVPHELIRKCSDYIYRQYGTDPLGYGPPYGLQKLREQIAQDLWSYGVPAGTEEIVITTGSQQALDLVARALINPGDTVLMEEHSYPGAINAFSAAGARMMAVNIDEEGPVIASLNAALGNKPKALYLMPASSNPTGLSISARRRKELVDWSHQAGVPIIEDDYGADLDEKHGPTPIRALDSEVLYLGTFSKKLIPALRVGFLVCPPGLGSRIVALKQGMDLGTSMILQYLLSEFISRGYLRTHLKRIQPEYKARKEALAAALAQHLPEEIDIKVPHYGVVFWINLPKHIDPDVLFQEALKQGVLITPGSFHSVYPHASAGVRLTFCAEPAARLKQGAEALGKAFKAVMEKAENQKTSSLNSSVDGV